MLRVRAAGNTNLAACSLWPQFALSLAFLNDVCPSLMPSLCSIVQNSFRDQRAVFSAAASLRTKHCLLGWVPFATYLPSIFLEIVLWMLKTAPEQHMPAPSKHSYLPGARVLHTVRLWGCTEQKLPPSASSQAEDQLLCHLWETKWVSSLLKRESVHCTLLISSFRKSPSLWCKHALYHIHPS